MKKQLTERQRKNVVEIHEEAIRIIDVKLKEAPHRMEKNRLYRSRKARVDAINALYQ